jgi:hypothetical protein
MASTSSGSSSPLKTAKEEPPAPSRPKSESAASTPAALPPGELVLSTIPDGAQIAIDGKSDPAWRTPYTARGVAAGGHTVTFTLAGYAGETRLVELSPGRQAFVAAKLKAQPATLSLDSDPPGASIFVDGADIGKVTPAQLPLAAGDHEVILRKAGYGDLETSVHLAANQPSNFSGALTPVTKGAPVSVNKIKHLFVAGKVPVEIRTRPKGAQVLIDGVVQSHTTPLKTQLQPGSYDITLRLSGYKDLQQSVTVEKDTPVELDEAMEKQ